jgi:sec-independent protein translocase protein TatB
MFDVGFSEILVIAVVALIVIGPERLPKVARTMGILLGRMQRYVNDVKADISREMELEELRKLQSEMKDAAQSFETTVAKEIGDTEQALNQTIAPALEAVREAENPGPSAPEPAAAAPAQGTGRVEHAAGAEPPSAASKT